jgi:phage-related minor tail protein
MSKNMNKRTTKRKSATENSILKFLTVSSVSSDSIVKGIIDDIVNTAVKTAEPKFPFVLVLTYYVNRIYL